MFSSVLQTYKFHYSADTGSYKTTLNLRPLIPLPKDPCSVVLEYCQALYDEDWASDTYSLIDGSTFKFLHYGTTLPWISVNDVDIEINVSVNYVIITCGSKYAKLKLDNKWDTSLNVEFLDSETLKLWNSEFSHELEFKN